MKDFQYIYNYLIKILDISKIGLMYSKDPYAVNNYSEIQTLSMEILEKFMDMKFDRPNYFERNVYPTPNVSCRAVIINEKKQILLVQEKCDEGYAIPGGWCDLYDTPTEAVIREAEEEAGVKIKVKRIAAILSKKPLTESDNFVPEYALFFECEILEDLHTHDHEILDVGFFDLDNLPKFSWKIKQSEFDRAVDAVLNNKTIVD